MCPRLFDEMDEASDLISKMGATIDNRKNHTALLEREIVSMELYRASSDRVGNGILFGEDFTTNFGMNIDYTKSTIVGALQKTVAGQSTTPIAIVNEAGFAVGQEITIYDDLNQEDVTIVSFDQNGLIVGKVLNNYKANAGVARSTMMPDGTFGKWGATSLSKSSLRFKTQRKYEEIAIFVQHDAEIVVTSPGMNTRRLGNMGATSNTFETQLMCGVDVKTDEVMIELTRPEININSRIYRIMGGIGI